MITLNVVTKNELGSLFVKSCKKLEAYYSRFGRTVYDFEEYEFSLRFRDLIYEYNNNKTFNLLANLCAILNEHKESLLQDELEEFLRIMGSA